MTAPSPADPTPPTEPPDGEPTLEQIAHEVFLRLQRGESPSPEEYVLRYPHLADRLRALFAASQVLREAARSVHDRWQTRLSLSAAGREPIPATIPPASTPDGAPSFQRSGVPLPAASSPRPSSRTSDRATCTAAASSGVRPGSRSA